MTGDTLGAVPRPRTGETPHHNVRVPPDLWNAAVARARAEDTTLSKVIVAFLRRYTADSRVAEVNGKRFRVEYQPGGWPGAEHSATNDYPRGDCPGRPTWKVERITELGERWGHTGYYCTGDLPDEYR